MGFTLKRKDLLLGEQVFFFKSSPLTKWEAKVVNRRVASPEGIPYISICTELVAVLIGLSRQSQTDTNFHCP